MCDCFHLAFPNWHDTSAGTGTGRRLRAPEPGGPDDSICEEPSQYAEGERPRPQGSSPVEEYPETERFSDSDKELDADRHNKKKEKKNRKSGFGYIFEKSSTPKMSKLKEAQSPDSGVIVKTAKDGCAEGLIYGGGGKEGIFIKEVVPESPASKSLKLREGDQILSATVYFDNVPYEDAVQILEHAQAYNVKLCLKRKPEITGPETAAESDIIPEDGSYNLEMRDKERTKRRGDARISWPKFPTLGKGRKSHFKRSHSSSEADEQKKLELSPTTSDTESPIKSQDALKGKKRNKMKLPSLKKTGRVSSTEGQDTDAPTIGYEIETQEGLPASLESPSREIQGGEVDLEDSRQVIPQSPDKVELLSIETTLKSGDLPSPTKSPDGKKKKKEKSDLKIRILGKDKSSKKDGKGKASPKRLKTLGASLEIAERPKTEESDASKCVDSSLAEPDSGKDQTDLSNVALLEVSPQKSKEKTKKKRSKDKSSPKFKLPKIGFVDYTVEQPQKTLREDNQGHVEKQSEQNKEELYGSQTGDGFSRTQLPKREDIEIPGMEDASLQRINGNGETLQLSIDVNSVKEAVSKLPGYKLPQVDTDGVLIPEEIIVIDANAQRISVKSPTKVSESKPDTLSSDVTSLEPRKQEEQDVKSRKTKKGLSGFGIPKFDLSFTDFSIVHKQSLPVKSASTGILQEEAPLDKDIKAPILETLPLTSYNGVEIPTDGIEYIDSAGSPDKEDLRAAGIDVKAECEAGVDSTMKPPKLGEGLSQSNKDAEAVEKVVIKTPEKQERGGLFKMPSFSISLPKFTVPGVDSSKPSASLAGTQVEVKTSNFNAEQNLEIQTSTKENDQKSANDPDEQSGQFKQPVLDIAFPKLEASGETGIKVPETESQEKTAEVGIKSPDFKIEAKSVTDSPSRFRMPKFKLPRLDIGFKEGGTMNGTDTETKLGVETVETAVHVEGAAFETQDIGSSKTAMDVTVDVKYPEDELNKHSIEVEVKSPEIKMTAEKTDDSSSKFKMPKFKMPKFGAGTASVSAEPPSVDLNIPATEKDVNTDTTRIDVDDSGTEVQISGERKGSKFTMPSLGLSMPSAKTPKIDLSLSGDNAEVDLPKAATEVEGSIDVDTNIVNIPKVEAEVKLPDVHKTAADSKAADGQSDNRGGKFKMPKFGIRMPKVEVSNKEMSPSHKDSGVTSAKAEAKIEVPDCEGPAADVKVKSPEITIGVKNVDESSKFKMPKFKLPKVGVGSTTASVDVSDVDTDIQIKGVDINIPEDDAVIDLVPPNVDVPSVELKTTGSTEGGKGGKFRMPHLGISVPKVKGPKIDLKVSDSKADIEVPETGDTSQHQGISIPELNVNIPEVNVEVKLPEDLQIDVDGKQAEGHGAKFKLPKFGIKMPKVKAPVIDLNLSSKDTEVTLPEPEIPEASVDQPSVEVEIKSPDIAITGKSSDESPSKYKMKKFKLPKFGVKASTGKTHASVEPIQSELEVDVNLTEKDLNGVAPEMTVKMPDSSTFEADLGKIDVSIPEAPGQKIAGDSKGGLKMPVLGIKMPKLKSAEVDLSKRADISVTGPKASVELTDVKAIEPIPTAGLSCELEQPKLEIALEGKTLETPELGTKDVNSSVDVEGGRFKLPKFGFSKPKFKVPEIDLNISKTGVEVENKVKEVDTSLTAEITGPEVKTEVTLPDTEIKVPADKVEIKAFGTDNQTDNVNESPSKFKLPSFKFPKFGAAPKVRVDVQAPEVETDLQIVPANLTVGKEESVDLEIQMPNVDLEASKPELDLSQLKSDDLKLSLEVKGPDGGEEMPSTNLEMKAPELNIRVQTAEDSPSKFWLPSFKLPKFGFGVTSSATVPDKEHEEIDGPEEVVEIVLEKGRPSIEITTKDVEVTLPSVQANVEPVDIDLKESMDDKNVSAEINVPTKDAKGYQSKFKMPTFKVPKLGIGTPSATIGVSGVEKSLKVDGHEEVSVEAPEVDMKTPKVEAEQKDMDLGKISLTLPEAKRPALDINVPKEEVSVMMPSVEADVQLPDVELKSPEMKAVAAPTKGSPSKFKMPSFKLPRIGIGSPQVTLETTGVEKGSSKVDKEFDLKLNTESIALEQENKEIMVELPKVDLKSPDIALPEVSAEVQLPGIKLESPAKVELKSSEVKAELKGSPSRFKMPAFKIPKFGVGFSSDMDKDIKIDDKQEVLQVSVDVPQTDIHTSVGLETKQKGIEIEIPKLRTSVPEIKGADIDLNGSNKEVDISLPAVSVELPSVELKETHKVEVKSPEKKALTVDTKGSPSKFKMPSFKLPKFGIGAPSATIEAPDMESSLVIDGNKDVGSVNIVLPDSSIDSSVKLGTTGGIDGKELKIETKEVQLPEKVKVDIKSPEVKAVLKEEKGSPSKFKMPSLKLPKIGIGTASAAAVVEPSVKTDDTEEVIGVSMEAPHGIVSSSVGIDITRPKVEVKEVEMEQPNIDVPNLEVTLPTIKAGIKSEKMEAKVEKASTEIKAAGKDAKASPSKFKMPVFKLPKIGIGSSGGTTEVPEAGLKLEGEAIDVSVTSPSLTIESTKIDHESKESQIEIPMQLEANVTLPSIESDIQLQATGPKESSAKIEFETPVIKAVTKDTKGSPSKFKMPTFKLPKFGSQSATVEVSKAGGITDVAVEPTDDEQERKEMEVHLPDIDSSAPKVEGAEVDISLQQKDVDVTLPKIEAEFPHEIKLPTLDLSTDKAQDSSSDGTPATNLEDKIKKSKFSFPKFSFSKQTSKDLQVNVSQPTVDVSIAEGKVEVIEPPVEVKLVESGAEAEGKEGKFKMPKFGISLTKPKSSESDLVLLKTDDSAALPKVEVVGQDAKEAGEINVQAKGSEKEGTGSKFKVPSLGFSVQGGDSDGGLFRDVEVQLPKVEAKVQLSEDGMEPTKMSEAEVDAKMKRSNWSFPKFSFSRTGGKQDDVTCETTTEDLSESQAKMDGSKSCVEFSQLSETNTEYESATQSPELNVGPTGYEGDSEEVLTTPEVKTSDIVQPLTTSETKANETVTEVKDASGSPFKFKLPSVKMSLFRSQTSSETSLADKESETKVEGANLEEDTGVKESPKKDATETKSGDQPSSPVSPSRFQLPLFKMPTLGFSRPQPEEEYLSVESKNDQLEIKVEPQSPKSPKSALASVGDMLQNLTIEFDVSKEKAEKVETPNGTLERQMKLKEKEAVLESPKRSDWGGWFKFPTFGLSSPSEQRRSPAKEAVGEEVSPTSSVQSSDAFADVSSTITSEPTGLSPSTPTKVTVKYTDPDDKIHSNITASTKVTQVISVEPMMAEKITNLSSGVSSSSEDTLRLESGKIHLLTSNIQATPESHHTKLVTYVHDQSDGTEATGTEAREPGNISFEKHVIQKQSSESRETVVITKQITRVFSTAAEPITNETATSIRQLKESVHSEKMRFFDKAKK